jgi:acyl-CoA thioesterase I
MRRRFFIAVAAAGCGCRSSEPARKPAEKDTLAPQLAPAPAAAADTRPVIVCFGDSLTAGFGLDPGASFPDILQHELDALGYRYRVANFGVSGDTTQDGVERLPLVLAEKPAIVLLEFGGNDGLRGQPVANTRANLRRIVEALRSAGARVVLAGMTLPPNYGPDYIRGFEAVYRGLAAEFKLPLIPFLLEGVADNSALMLPDGIHPTAEGARRVAATVLKALTPLLRK